MGHIMNAAQLGELDRVRDLSALSLLCIDQATIDHGRFDVAWTLSLLEEPPAQLFQSLPSPIRTSPFSPLADQTMAAIALAYMRELDTMAVRRSELQGGNRQRQGGAQPKAPLVVPSPSVDSGAASSEGAASTSGGRRRRPRAKPKP